MIVGMLDYALLPGQLAELRQAHRRTRDKREADRIKAVVLLATGWTAEAVTEVLPVDPNTVRAYFKRYGKRGLEGLRRVGAGGSVGLLKAKHLVEVGHARLQANLYLSAKEVAYWVKEAFGVSYPESGMTVECCVGLCVQEAPAGAWQGRPGSANAIPRNVQPYPQSQGPG